MNDSNNSSDLVSRLRRVAQSNGKEAAGSTSLRRVRNGDVVLYAPSPNEAYLGIVSEDGLYVPPSTHRKSPSIVLKEAPDDGMLLRIGYEWDYRKLSLDLIIERLITNALPFIGDIEGIQRTGDALEGDIIFVPHNGFYKITLLEQGTELADGVNSSLIHCQAYEFSLMRIRAYNSESL